MASAKCVICLKISLIDSDAPDLGTSLLIGASGLYVLFFSGFSIQIIKHNKWLNLGVIFSVVTVAEWLDGSFESQNRLKSPAVVRDTKTQ
jgi:rod shape determining protein RodA